MVCGAVVVFMAVVTGAWVGVHTAAVPVPTQYASFSQKFVAQSEETAGFHFKNCSLVMLNAAGTLSQSSPETMLYQELQLLTTPVMVGLSGHECVVLLSPATVVDVMSVPDGAEVFSVDDEVVAGAVNDETPTQ